MLMVITLSINVVVCNFLADIDDNYMMEAMLKN
jgi:hypothetical protein